MSGEFFWAQIFLFWICPDANRLVQVLSVWLASGSVLIIDEGVADWHGRAVVAGEEEGRNFSPRTIFKDSETVFGSGWACSGLAPGLLLGC